MCDTDGGQCQCVSNYGGRRCDQCRDGYYSYPDCASEYTVLYYVTECFIMIGHTYVLDIYVT